MSIQRLSLPSTIRHCALLRRIVLAFCCEAAYGARFTASLALAVHEAFVNAVRHGNGSDQRLPVVVTFRTFIDRGRPSLQIAVIDRGHGFTCPPQGASILPENPLATGGRGLALIAHVAESMHVEPFADGSMLVMRYIPS